MTKRLLRALPILLLIAAAALVMGDAFQTDNFVLINPADPTIQLRFDLSAMATGSRPNVSMPDYGGGTFALNVGEGNLNDVLMSQGTGFNPGWQPGFLQNGGPNLTAGRVPFATSGVVLADDADLKFSTDSLTITKINNQSLRVQAHVL